MATTHQIQHNPTHLVNGSAHGHVNGHGNGHAIPHLDGHVSPQLHRQRHLPNDTERQAFQELVSKVFGSVYTKKPENFQAWVDFALEKKKELETVGSDAPLVWVLVQNNKIPANAIVAGIEKRQPVYVARTYYEGSLCVGKAAHHLNGCSIPYNGIEIKRDVYEVLVPAMKQKITYMIDDKLEMPPILRTSHGTVKIRHHVPTNWPPRKEELSKIKTVVLVDDSHSMLGKLWGDAREALAQVVRANSMVTDLEGQGIDLCFMNSGKHGENFMDASDLHAFFDSVSPSGETPLGERLEQLVDYYLPRVEGKHSQHLPIVLVVITDGEPTDNPVTSKVIVETAERLRKTETPWRRFVFHFVQIGDDYDATKYLEDLDTNLSLKFGCRDIVDLTPYDGWDKEFTVKKMFEALEKSIKTTEKKSPVPVPEVKKHDAPPHIETDPTKHVPAKQDVATPKKIDVPAQAKTDSTKHVPAKQDVATPRKSAPTPEPKKQETAKGGVDLKTKPEPKKSEDHAKVDDKKLVEQHGKSHSFQTFDSFN